MNGKRESMLRIAAFCCAGLLGVTMTPTVADGQAIWVRWDIPTVVPGVSVSPGGFADALARNGERIRLTGSGTFLVPATSGASSAVAGGGMWSTFDTAGNAIGGGTYEVAGLVAAYEAPGTFPAQLVNLIGDPAAARAGLAVLSIRYSDGDQGILVLNSRFPATPPTVPLGVSAAKGFAHYFNIQQGVGGIDGNRAIFHVGR